METRRAKQLQIYVLLLLLMSMVFFRSFSVYFVKRIEKRDDRIKRNEVQRTQKKTEQNPGDHKTKAKRCNAISFTSRFQLILHATRKHR